MTVTELLMLNSVLILIAMVLLWLVSLRMRDASIVDIFWGLGFVAVAWCSYFSLEDQPEGRWLIPILVTVWGTRLSVYLAWRNHGKPEDYRYQAMRERNGAAFWWRSLITVFLLQGAVMWLVSLPIQLGLATPERPPTWQIAAGVALWTVGFLFETVGDLQLTRFKAVPANSGEVMDRGLWRYTRHPNYFGDFLVWWGLFFVSASISIWWTAISPIVMSVFLMRVSGVTLLEAGLNESKPGYAEYTGRTNAFFPWRPRPSNQAGHSDLEIADTDSSNA